MRLAPCYLNGLREFNYLKRLVANCADKNGQVDTEMLRSLIDQVELRIKIILTQIQMGDLEVGKDEEELWQDGLTELCSTEPKNVEMKLAREAQLLNTLADSFNGIKTKITNLRGEVKLAKKLSRDVRHIRN